MVAGTDVGRGFIYAAPMGGTFTNNIFNPTFANGSAPSAIKRIGGSDVTMSYNYFSMANSNNAPFYISAITTPPSFSITNVAANNSFVSPGGVIISNFIGKNTMFTGTAANSSYPAPGCIVLPFYSLILSVQKISPTSCPVQWKTIGEKDISHFIVETSKDGVNFSHLTMVTSKGDGDNLYYLNYIKPSEVSRTFFRIKAVDAQTNRSYYSEIKPLTWNSDIYQVFPNPASTYIYIEGEKAREPKIFKLSDVTGKQVLVKTFFESVIQLPINQFNKGVYFYEIKSGYSSLKQRGKLIIQ